MTLYKKNPVEIEAVQFTGDNWDELFAFCGSHSSSGGTWDIRNFNPIGTFMHFEGDRTLVPAELWVEANKQWLPIEIGEWILKDRIGYYPCKDSIFQETYTKVDKEK